MLILLLAIGFVAGLRSMTAPAAVSWAAYLGWIDLHDSAFRWMGSGVAVAVFTIAALAELVADKLPRTPRRTAAGPLVGRFILGGLAGAALAASIGESLLAGALLGGIGAMVGSFAGYESRRRLVRVFGGKDLRVALVEDLITIALAYLVVNGLNPSP
jgi:uncharacterized membrane protein